MRFLEEVFSMVEDSYDNMVEIMKDDLVFLCTVQQ